ncbi:MAG TPA: amidohydrolase family protein [Chloroflexota bacterium]|jgi:predicted TIM-barrel fold metal-dependent hydrolase
MTVIDADTHVDETENTWEYLLPSERQYRPACEIDGRDGKPYWVIDGARFLRIPRDFEKTGTTVETRELMDVKARVADMDRIGTEVQVIYPTLFLLAPAERPEVDLAVRRAYNRWVGEACDQANGRLRWVCLLPAGSPEAWSEELRWAKQHGAVGVMKKGDTEFGRWPVDPYFYPLYEEAQRLDLAICFHQGTGMPDIATGPTFSYGRFQRLPLSVVNGFYSFCTNSIPQRFPRLRFGYVEAGASWVPYVSYDLTRRAEKQPDGGNIDGVKFELKRDLLVDNRAYVTCQTDEDFAHILQHTSGASLIIGSDYGHSDPSKEHQFIELLDQRARRGDLAPDLVRQITYDNAKALYGL